MFRDFSWEKCATAASHRIHSMIFVRAGRRGRGEGVPRASTTNGLVCRRYKLLPSANEVCEGYVFTGVCLSTGGERCMAEGVCMVGCAWQGGHVWQGGLWPGGLLQGGCVARGMHGRGRAWQGVGMHGTHVPSRQILRDTVNERAVRILLECILV